MGSLRFSHVKSPLASPSVRHRLTYFWRVAVDIRGSALPSAAKGKEESLSAQGVCLCVEQSRGCGRSAFNFAYPVNLTNVQSPGFILILSDEKIKIKLKCLFFFWSGEFHLIGGLVEQRIY